MSSDVYLPRIFRFPWQRTSNTAPRTSVHPEILSLGGLGDDYTGMSTRLWRSHNGLTHPTPSGELTGKLSQFLNKWEVPHNRGIIDGISSIFYRINVSCFVLMKAYFIISIFLMTLNSVYVYRFSGSKVEKRVSTNKSRRNDKNKFFAFL